MNFLKEKSIYLLLFLTFLFYFQGVLELPVMDRDEARFVTASKTMLENENFIDIQMHDEALRPLLNLVCSVSWDQFFSTFNVNRYIKFMVLNHSNPSGFPVF